MKEVKTSTLISILAAAHLTHRIDALPAAFIKRGGIMLVAPPENFKTTLSQSVSGYRGVSEHGDMNVQALVGLRNRIACGEINTLLFPAYEKIYKRDSDTASNVEGHLQAMVEEGFSHASFENKEMFVRIARCLIIAAITEKSFNFHRKNGSWVDEGFSRRFINCYFIVKDANAIIKQSLIDWKPLVFTNNSMPEIPTTPIRWNVTRPEAERLVELVEHQDGLSTPGALIQKIFCVLKWHHRGEKKAAERAMDLVEEFSYTFDRSGGGAHLVVK